MLVMVDGKDVARKVSTEDVYGARLIKTVVKTIGFVVTVISGAVCLVDSSVTCEVVKKMVERLIMLTVSRVSSVKDGLAAMSVRTDVLVNKNISSTEKVTGTILVSVMLLVVVFILVVVLVTVDLTSL